MAIPLTLEALTEILRNRLGLPANEIPRLKTLVDQAVQALIEREGSAIDKRHYTFTLPTVVATLDIDGSVDIGSLITDEGIFIEGLRFGEIRHPSSPFPLKQIGATQEGALGSNYAGLGLLRYAMTGTRLQTYSTDNNATPLAGDISFAVPFANGLANMNAQLINNLIDFLVMQERGVPDGQAVAE